MAPRIPVPAARCLAVTSVAAMAVLAAGCGEEPSSGFRPSAAATAAPATAPSATPSATATQPEIVFPEDFKVVYEADVPQAKAQAAMNTFEDFWKAWWYAMSTDGKDKRYLDYVAPGSQTYGTGLFADTVADWQQEHVRPTGVVRVHGVRVISAGDKSVTLTGCGDETRAGTKDLTTGKVSWTFGKQKTSRYKIRVQLVPASSGGWRVRAYEPVSVTSAAGRECR
jgi:hypothetical protein